VDRNPLVQRQIELPLSGFEERTGLVRVSSGRADRCAADRQRGDQYGPLRFDAKGVEFGPWIRRFLAQLKKNWYPLIPQIAMSLQGHSVLAFDVYKDGRLKNIELVNASAVGAFNEAAKRALVLTDPTESLPEAYPAEMARFTITFSYNEKPPDLPDTVSPQ
jgi:TonB family protein